MTEAERRRGQDTEDPRAFALERLGALRSAVEEVSWLLGRGYPMDLAVRAAGDHHQLHARARLALTRASTAPERASERRRKRLPPEGMDGANVSIDAFNILVTMEVARGGGPVFLCADGALRDLAGLRGSYKCVADTEPAVERVILALAEHGAASVRVFVDEPVSNSGRVRALFEAAVQRAVARVERSGRAFAGEARTVRDADAAMEGAECAVSADAVVIDRAEAWVSLAADLLGDWAPDAWVIDLR